MKHGNVAERGSMLQDMLTLLYGTPEVVGIVLWNAAPPTTSNVYGSELLDQVTFEVCLTNMATIYN